MSIKLEAIEEEKGETSSHERRLKNIENGRAREIQFYLSDDETFVEARRGAEVVGTIALA